MTKLTLASGAIRPELKGFDYNYPEKSHSKAKDLSSASSCKSKAVKYGLSALAVLAGVYAIKVTYDQNQAQAPQKCPFEDVPEYQSLSPVHKVVYCGTEDEVEEVFKNVVDLDLRNNFSGNLLEEAMSRSKRVFEAVLNAKPKNINLQDIFNQTILHKAAGFGPLSHYIQQLLAAGANPNTADSKGNTPLHIALEARACLPSIQALLNQGANPNASNNGFMTPLHIIGATLRGRQEREEPIANTDLEVDHLRMLLTYNPNPDAMDRHCMTPLHYAAKAGNKLMMEMLLQHGADPSLARKMLTSDYDCDGKTVADMIPADKRKELLPLIEEALNKHSKGKN